MTQQHGTHFPDFFNHISPRLHFPVRATLAAFTFACLYGILYLASTTAFNSIITSAVLFLNLSYAIPQAILLFRGRQKMLPTRYLDLKSFGHFCNVFAMLWTAVLTVMICFPPALPVSKAVMNYTSVVLVGMCLVVLGLWGLWGGRGIGARGLVGRCWRRRIGWRGGRGIDRSRDTCQGAQTVLRKGPTGLSNLHPPLLPIIHLPPLLLQHTHLHGIMIFPVMPEEISPSPLVDKPQPLIQPHSALIPRHRPDFHTMEVGSFEAPAKGPFDGFAAVALALVGAEEVDADFTWRC